MGKFFPRLVYLDLPCTTHVHLSISLILPALLTFTKLSLLPRAMLRVFVTGLRSSGIETLLGPQASATSTPSLPTVSSSTEGPRASKIAYQSPQQIQIVPTLPVPEILRIASRKPSIKGRVTEWRCLRSDRPIYLCRDYRCAFGLLRE